MRTDTTRKRLINVGKILILIAWISLMILIAWFSSKPAVDSTNQSHVVGEVICRIVIKDFKTFTQAVKEYYVEAVDHFVRKSAHFLEYALLGFMSWLVLNISLSGIIRKPSSSDMLPKAQKFVHLAWNFLLPIAWCCLYSITDEIHQHFVEGRYASVGDVLIDTSGSAFGVLFLLLVTFIIKKIRTTHKISKNHTTKSNR